jgi:hypothetical protein
MHDPFPHAPETISMLSLGAGTVSAPLSSIASLQSATTPAGATGACITSHMIPQLPDMCRERRVLSRMTLARSLLGLALYMVRTNCSDASGSTESCELRACTGPNRLPGIAAIAIAPSANAHNAHVRQRGSSTAMLYLHRGLAGRRHTHMAQGSSHRALPSPLHSPPRCRMQCARATPRGARGSRQDCTLCR